MREQRKKWEGGESGGKRWVRVRQLVNWKYKGMCTVPCVGLVFCASSTGGADEMGRKPSALIPKLKAEPVCAERKTNT